MTATDLVLLMENRLGLRLDIGLDKPEWKDRSRQAGLLKKKMATNPKLFTEDNIRLTIEWCHRKRKPVKSAAGICFFVQQALDDRVVDEAAPVTSLDRRVQQAIASEQALGNPDGFVELLSRASGSARGEVLKEIEQLRGWAK